MTLLLLFCPAMLPAQADNGVTVSKLVVETGSPTTVTFDVSWSDEHPEGFLWSDTVWVFVDYNNAGKMERLLLSGATLTAPSWSAASVTFGKDGNNKGAWVVGNAKTAVAGSFSAMVQLLTDIPDLSGVCAYASNYPPVGEYNKAEYEIKFTGTPMYNIVLKHESGATITRRADSPFSVPASYTVQSFTDATGAPGIIIVNCHAPGATGVTFAAFSPCTAITGSTWTLTDDRDRKTYKVKYMPDGQYWMVQNLGFGDRCASRTSVSSSTATGNVNSTGLYYGDCCVAPDNLSGYIYNRTAALNIGSPNAPTYCDGTTSGLGLNDPASCRGICPENWHVPTLDEFRALDSAFGSSPWCPNKTTCVWSPDYFALDPIDLAYCCDSGELGISSSSREVWWYRNDGDIRTNSYNDIDPIRCLRNY
jgi:uncharacterized protein (TIGR02145 family)